MRTAVVTRQTGRAALLGRDLRKFPDVAFRVVVHVLLARAMTALTALRRRGRTGIQLLPVRRAFEGALHLVVAERAGVAAHIPVLRRRRRRRYPRRGCGLRCRL